MLISSSAFKNMDRIPDEFTCSGENINPPLEFAGIPEEAQSLVLIVEDPDAPTVTWDHWLVYNIDPLTPGISPDSIPNNGIQTTNSFGQIEYSGPCPPPGKPHRYFFKLYALDIMIDESLVSDKLSLQDAMQGHILAHSELVGLYSKL